MDKMLYDIFQERWDRGGSIYLYSDPHLKDLDSYKIRFPEEFDSDDATDISELTKQTANKCTVEHLDQMQINNINKVCGKKDVLIILGDVGDIECVKKLRAGYKVLVMGNHDKGASNYRRVIKKDFSEVTFEELMKTDRTHLKIDDNHLFDEVYEGPLWISSKIVLSHEPLPITVGVNIHGHTHGDIIECETYKEYLQKMKDECSTNISVIAEQVKYTPVSLKTIVTSGVLKNVSDIHRTYIDTRLKTGKAYE